MAKLVDYSFKQLLLPRYWPTWLVIGLLWLFSHLPHSILQKLGRRIGNALYRFSTKMRHTANVNIKLCFPNLSRREQSQLVKKSFTTAGVASLETALAWWAPDKRLKSLYRVHGEHYLRKAISERKGVMMLGSHLCTLQIAGRLYSRERELSVVYRRQKNPVFDFIQRRMFPKYYKDCIVRDDMRGLIRALRNKKIVWYTPDIDPKHHASIFAPFFGVSASTVTIPARVARSTGAKLVPSAYYRREDGSYDICFYPALELTGDVANDTALINRTLEKIIRKKPEQYLWQYKRFKTRPPGETNPYKLIEDGEHVTS